MGDDLQRGTESTVSPARPSRRIAPFFRDLGVTVAAQAAVAAGGLLLARLLATKTGTEGFASYSLVKQAVNLLFPIVTVGLVGGLPRYLALPAGKDDPSAGSYLAAAALICGVATAVCSGLALAAPGPTAAAFFGSDAATGLVAPFALLLAATSAFYVAFGYFRGLVRMRAAALLQVLGIAVVPSAVVLAFPDRPVDELILLMASGLAVLSLAAIAWPLARQVIDRRARTRRAARSLFDYGHRRVPGELAQLGLFALVPALAAHVGSVTDVAYLSAGQLVLSLLSLAVLPVGLLLLPSLTRAWATDREAATSNVARLAAFAAHVAIFASVQALLYADIAVRAWLGPGFDDAGSVVRATVAPAGLFVVYLMLRSALDAVAVTSYNSRNNLIALAVFAGVAAVSLGTDIASPVMCVAWSFAAGVATQGALTLATVHRHFGLTVSDYALGVALPAGLVTAAAGAALRPVVDGSGAELALLAAVQLVLAAAYFGVLVRAGVAWVRLIAERLFEQRRA
jgi:O-antigen/teichoic acid export membrane protein